MAAHVAVPTNFITAIDDSDDLGPHWTKVQWWIDGGRGNVAPVDASMYP